MSSVIFVVVGRCLLGATDFGRSEPVVTTQPATSAASERPGGSGKRGRRLFTELGCHACHGENGVGGVDNANYVLGTVPALDVLTERLLLMQPEDAQTIVGMLEQGLDPTSVADDPPFPNYHRFLAQYGAVTRVIKNGATTARKDPSGPPPPLQMPPWGDRLSDEDFRALMVYMIELYDWEE